MQRETLTLSIKSKLSQNCLIYSPDQIYIFTSSHSILKKYFISQFKSKFYCKMQEMVNAPSLPKLASLLTVYEFKEPPVRNIFTDELWLWMLPVDEIVMAT